MLKCTRGASFALPSIFLFPTARGRPSCVSFNFLAHKYLFILFFLSGDKFIKFLQLVLHVISSHSIVHGCCWGWSLQRTNSLALNVRAVYQLYPMSGGGKSLFRAPHSHLFGVKIAQWIRSRCTGNCHHRVCASVSVRVCILWNKMNFPFLYFGVNKLEGSVVVTSVFGTHCHIGNHTMVAFQLAISHFECALRASHAKCYSVRPVSDCTKQHSAHVPSAMISLCGQSWEDLFFLVIFTDDSFFFFFLALRYSRIFLNAHLIHCLAAADSRMYPVSLLITNGNDEFISLLLLLPSDVALHIRQFSFRWARFPLDNTNSGIHFSHNSKWHVHCPMLAPAATAAD